MENKVLYWILIIGIIIFAGFQLLLPELADFPAGIVKIGIGIIIYWLFDKYLLKEIDTIEELKKGNTAYALFIFALCYLLATLLK